MTLLAPCLPLLFLSLISISTVFARFQHGPRKLQHSLALQKGDLPGISSPVHHVNHTRRASSRFSNPEANRESRLLSVLCLL